MLYIDQIYVWINLDSLNPSKLGSILVLIKFNTNVIVFLLWITDIDTMPPNCICLDK